MPDLFLRVHRYNRVTEESKPLLIYKGTGDLKQQKLETIRQSLQKENSLDSKFARSPFCHSDGSEVPDTLTLKDYLKSGAVKPSQSVPAEQNNGNQGNGQTSEKVDIYYKEIVIKTQLDDETKQFLASKLNLQLKQSPEKLPKLDLKPLLSTFDPNQWSAKATKAVHPADLSERDWSVIVRTNSLLSGQKVVVPESKGSKKNFKIERSPRNAFELNPRPIGTYERATEAKDKDRFSIPRFVVDDDSYVTVLETSTSLEKSVADSSFSETSVEASAGGGFFGVSVAAKAGYQSNDSNQSLNQHATTRHTLHVFYNFPKVVVYLDPRDLKLSADCKDAIKKVIDQKSLKRFSEDYGDIFAQEVQLGGRLSSTEENSSTTKAITEEQKSQFKAAASASISSSFAQASFSASHGRGHEDTKSGKDAKMQKSISWEAKGGDTVLCNNPAEWCATVGSFYNWRVVKQDAAFPLYEIITQVTGDERIRDRFTRSASNTFLQGQDHVWIKCHLMNQMNGMPLRCCTHDRSLANEVSQIEKYKGSILGSIQSLNASIRCDGAARGDDLWETLAFVGSGGPEGPYYGSAYPLWNGTVHKYARCTPPVNKKSYLYFQDDWRGFYFTHTTSGPPDVIPDNGLVMLQDCETGFYLAMADSGIVYAKPWNDEEKHSFLTFKFQYAQRLNPDPMR